MNRKRKRCWGLSSCCTRERSESAQMIAGKSTMSQPPTKCGKFKSCMCYPFEKMCYPFKRRKVEGMEMEEEKLSWWKRICCCSGCCKRCSKGKKEEKEKMKKVGSLKAQDLNESYSFNIVFYGNSFCLWSSDLIFLISLRIFFCL